MGGGSELGLHRVEHADALLADHTPEDAVAGHILGDDVVVEQPGLRRPRPVIDGSGKRIERVATANGSRQLKPVRDNRHILDGVAHRQEPIAHLVNRPGGGCEQLPLFEYFEGKGREPGGEPGPQGQPPGMPPFFDPRHPAGGALRLPAILGGGVCCVHTWLLNSGNRLRAGRVRCEWDLSVGIKRGFCSLAQPRTAPEEGKTSPVLDRREGAL